MTCTQEDVTLAHREKDVDGDRPSQRSQRQKSTQREPDVSIQLPTHSPSYTHACQESLSSHHTAPGNHSHAPSRHEEVTDKSSAASDGAASTDQDSSNNPAPDHEDSADDTVSDEFEPEDFSEEDESDYDELAEWPWLKAVDVRCQVEGQEVGLCHGKVINRAPIRANFYTDIEEPTSDTAEFGFDLFDRWGNLKTEYIQHPVKKGSGVWGKEFNEGRILLIEYINVKEEYRGKGYGKKLVADTWTKAQDLFPQCKFAVTCPTWLWSSIRKHYDALPEDARSPYLEGIQLDADRFWRACGFRRIGSSCFFGLARDHAHPSHTLTASNDYRGGRVLGGRKMAKGQQLPYDEALVLSDDATTLDSLKARLELHPSTDKSWHTVDAAGGNLMHMLADTGKPQSLKWLLGMPFADQLRQQKNYEGETPLESMEATLEGTRVKMEVGLMTIARSDDFAGYSPQHVECMALFRNMTAPSKTELQQLTYGCTCGQCIAGFVSPRLAFALICQGEIGGDMLSEESMMTPDGDSWVEWNDDYLQHVERAVKQNMRTNKSLRLGFANLVGYVALALKSKRLPTQARLIAISNAAGEWPPYTRNFLQRGGRPISAVLACFDIAMDQDRYLGDGNHEEVFGDEIEKLPECRNDREFIFVQRRLLALDPSTADDLERLRMMTRENWPMMPET